jgi:DNA-directed RNA polymerase I, II, and III subunit RPABC1
VLIFDRFHCFLQSSKIMSNQGMGGLEKEASKMFRVRKTCFKLLSKRGYIVDDTSLNLTTDQFKSKYGESPSRENLTILVEKADDPTDQLFVFFPEDEKVGVKPIKTYCQRMKDENVSRAIIVVKVSLTPFAKTAVKEMALRGYRVEYFRDSELLVDITEHKLVPEHIVLTDQQKLELLERYRLKPSQLPRIQITDPIARYYGLRHHQVVKIIRPSETAGRYITYRICV